MKLVENIPLDTQIIAEMINDRDDLYLVWPAANWPFDHQQWREVLDPSEGNKSFLAAYFNNQKVVLSYEQDFLNRADRFAVFC